jgi:uncharacterized membrane protein AbrB (regulator of aidB expression)
VILSIAILQYTGSEFLDAERQDMFIRLLLPAFFMLWGMMIGRILALFFSQEIDPPAPMLMRGFIAGLIIGLASVILYFSQLPWNV